MEKRKLHLWQPYADELDGKLINDTIITQKGPELVLSMYFTNGGSMDIVYDQPSHITGDCIWAFRYVYEMNRQDLIPLIEEEETAKEKENIKISSIRFFKMTNSDFIEWYSQLGGISLEMIPDLEHHVFTFGDWVYEVLSEYEPKFILNKKEK